MDETADCRRHDGGAQACRAGVEDILGEDVILPAVGDGRRVDNSDREAGSLSECYKSCLQACIELSQCGRRPSPHLVAEWVEKRIGLPTHFSSKLKCFSRKPLRRSFVGGCTEVAVNCCMQR